MATAEGYESIASDATGRSLPAIDGPRLLALIDRLQADAPLAAIMPGSGFEGRSALLDAMADRTVLAGSPADTWSRCGDPDRFMALLQDLRIPFPTTITSKARWSGPSNADAVDPVLDERPSGWLHKRINGTGAAHIQWPTAQAGGRDAGDADDPTRSTSTYRQQRIIGAPMSLTCLVDQQQVTILGVNRLLFRPWPAIGSGRRIYAGAINGISLPARWHTQLIDCVNALLPALFVQGLCSVDFIGTASGFRILEVNPRFSATTELLASGPGGPDDEPSLPSGLQTALAVHLHVPVGDRPATDDPIPDAIARPAGGSRGMLTVFARTSLRWPGESCEPAPDFLSDLPDAGSAIAPAMPICTVHAQGACPRGTAAQLAERATLLNRWLCGNQTP